MTNPDILPIVGAGHNGLVSRGAPRQAGRKVLVLERGTTPEASSRGGPAAAGIETPALYIRGGRLRPDIVRDLDLARHGLGTVVVRRSALRRPAARWRIAATDFRADDAGTLDSIRRLSSRDARAGPSSSASSTRPRASSTPLTARRCRAWPGADVLGKGLPLASLALKLRRLGRKDLFRVIRSLSMSAQELTDDWFRPSRSRPRSARWRSTA